MAKRGGPSDEVIGAVLLFLGVLIGAAAIGGRAAPRRQVTPCPACGHPLHPGETECPSCGAGLRWE